MAEAAEKTEMPNLDKILGNYINDPDITPPTGSALDRLPEPTGWRMVVWPIVPKKKTDGGVWLPDSTVDKEKYASVCSKVLKMGSLCFRDPDKFGDSDPWCKIGDYVITARYSGSRFKIDGAELRIINDDEILAVVQDPNDIKHA